MWQRAFGYGSQGCWDYDVEQQTGRNRANRAGLNVEHVLELQTFVQFIRATITGNLRSGDTFEDTVDPRIWEDLRDVPYPPTVTAVNGHTTPMNRMWNAFGTKVNMDPLVLADKNLNGVKERMWNDRTAIRSDEEMEDILSRATNAAFTDFVNEVRNPLTVLQFIMHDEMRTRARAAYRDLRDEIQRFSEHARSLNYRNPQLHHMLDRFMRDHINTSIRDVRRFVRTYGDLGRAAIEGSGVQDERELLESLIAIRDGVADFEYDFSGWFSDDP